MNEAIKILNLENKYNIYNIKNIKIDELKKQFHILALERHPDKNNNINANEEFQKINSAYNLLKQFIENKEYNINYNENINDINDVNDINDKNFIELILNFIKLLNNEYDKNSFQNNCFEFSKGLLDDFFKDIDFHKLKEFIWVLNNDFIIKKYLNFYNVIDINLFKDYLYDKINNYEIIYLKPNLNQIYNSFIHKLDICNNIIIVPLWHKELFFKNYIIKIEADLSNNLIIDENNNIHYFLDDNILSLITKNYENKVIPININNTILFNIPIEKIIIKDKLIIKCDNIGLPKIDNKNILENTSKSDILVHINT